MKRKARRYDEGGVTEGQHPKIDDDTRARAMKFVEDASEESRDIKPRAEAKSTSKPAPKAKAKEEPKAKDEPKPKAETKEEYKARMEEISKKEPLENVSPEDYVPGGGMLKAGLKAIVGAGARRAAKEGAEAATKQIGSAAAKQLENKATKRIGLDKDTYKPAREKAREARSAARTKNMKQENYDAGPAGRARSSGAMVDDVRSGSTDMLSTELRSDFKKGGKVAGKLATRGYGKAR